MTWRDDVAAGLVAIHLGVARTRCVGAAHRADRIVFGVADESGAPYAREDTRGGAAGRVLVGTTCQPPQLGVVCVEAVGRMVGRVPCCSKQLLPKVVGVVAGGKRSAVAEEVPAAASVTCRAAAQSM
jgi:hypothetical protein